MISELSIIHEQKKKKKKHPDLARTEPKIAKITFSLCTVIDEGVNQGRKERAKIEERYRGCDIGQIVTITKYTCTERSRE